jgi:ferredoxin-type protein NapG
MAASKPKVLVEGRRRFLRLVAEVSGLMAVSGLALAGYLKSARHLVATAIRPPGALAEADFQSACVHCGLCVEACPFDILELARLEDPVPTGTPYFIAREHACEMCIDIPCVPACPTGALNHQLTDIKKASMGLAVFVGAETCYAMQGTSCRACYMACPVKDEAITMEIFNGSGRNIFQPTVHSDACTGCGKCEEACITAEASIKVLPAALAQQDIGTQIHGLS